MLTLITCCVCSLQFCRHFMCVQPYVLQTCCMCAAFCFADMLCRLSLLFCRHVAHICTACCSADTMCGLNLLFCRHVVYVCAAYCSADMLCVCSASRSRCMRCGCSLLFCRHAVCGCLLFCRHAVCSPFTSADLLHVCSLLFCRHTVCVQSVLQTCCVCILLFCRHVICVCAASCSADMLCVCAASCSADMTVKLWDFQGFECLKTMHGMTAGLFCGKGVLLMMDVGGSCCAYGILCPFLQCCQDVMIFCESGCNII